MGIKEKLRCIHWKRWMEYIGLAMIYPVLAGLLAEKKLLKFIDALTITGLVLLIVGVVLSLLRHGDFDIIEYVTRRSVQKGDIKSFQAFREDKEEKRKDSINYPFWTAVLLLLMAGILSLFY